MNRKWLSATLAVVLCLTNVPLAGAEAVVPTGEETAASAPGGETYDAYRDRYAGRGAGAEKLIFSCAENYQAAGAQVKVLDSYDGKTGVLEWSGEEGAVSWSIQIPQSGLYQLQLEYQALKGHSRGIELELAIDGELPFAEAEKFVFPRLFRDEANEDGRFDQDAVGNEVSPSQTELFQWQTAYFSDSDGMYPEPYIFYLEEGRHTITLTVLREPFVLASLVLTAPKTAAAYGEVKTLYPTASSPTDFYYQVQAENALYKTDRMVHPGVDRSSPATQPYDPFYMRMNIMGGANWVKPTQWVTWEIEVPEDGLYKLGFKYRQSYLKGLAVSRKLYIDDAVPFEEAKALSFSYGSGWKVLEPEVDGGTALFYLKKGKHTVRLEPTLGEAAEILRLLTESQAKLNEMYRKIIMITSTQPDTYRDYALDKEIPELLTVFREQAAILEEQGDKLEALSGSKGSEAAILDRFVEQLRSFIKQPNTIAGRLSKFQENLSGVAAWILQARDQPLELDYLYVASPEMEKPKASAGFFASLKHGVLSFLGSFLVDYNNVSGAAGGQEAIEVWVNSARDQANILSKMVDETFYKETGISVQVRLVTGALIQATMAGKGPDVAINAARGDPINLALRGAAVDLQDFEGFDGVKARFMPTALVPYELNGCTYALPETQVFDMMFYRTDIFEELGLAPPETWEDLYNIAPIIQRNNMQVGLPYNGIYSIFTTLLFQKGGQYYNADKSASVLNSQMGIEAFKEWVDFYLQYGFPLYKDDYNRFRTGEMPLTILSYTFYNQLMVAAPEIKGLWEMAAVPGTRDENGNIVRSETASGTACMILAAAEQPEKCWEFLKWWTRADNQAEFGNEIEALLGAAARYTTANVEGFYNLPWSKTEIELIESQWKDVLEIPEVPGGYYIARNLDNAFRSSVFRSETPREMLTYWTLESNKEIARKRREFGLDTAGD